MHGGEKSFEWGGEKIPIATIDVAKVKFHDKFGNNYWKHFNLRKDAPAEAAVQAAFLNSLTKFHKAENFGKYFKAIPDEVLDGKWHKDIASYWHTGKPQWLEGAPANVQEYAEGMGDAMAAHQREAIADGMWEAGEALERHVPAQTIGTPMPNIEKSRMAFVAGDRGPDVYEQGRTVLKGIDPETKLPITEEVTDYSMKMQFFPDMASHTLKTRGKYDNMPLILKDIHNGVLISSPADLTLRGLVMDRQKIHNFRFMRDYIMDTPGAVVPRSSYAAMSKEAAAQIVDLENLPIQGEVSAILRRMIQRKDPSFMAGDGGKMPYMHKAIYDEWFGEFGMWHQADAASSIIEAAVSWHKTMKTAFNPGTQVTNVLGNMAMQYWAGFNAMAPESLTAAVGLTRAFGKLSKANIDLKKEGLDLLDILKNPQALKDLDLGAVAFKNSDGKMQTFNLNEVFHSDIFHNLIEEQAFENVEGWRNMERLWERMPEGIGKKGFGAILATKKIPGVGAMVDKATSLYLQGDMVPKAQMYLKNIAMGFTPEAAAVDVARSLPMYGSVGPGIAALRKSWAPWITFPSEMMRIMKNRMMENPMRMAPWLQAQGIMQSMMYAGGGVESYEDVKEAEQSLPEWARTPTTVIGGGPAAAIGAGGFAGASAGMLGGTLAGARAGGAAGGKMGIAGLVGGTAAGAAGAYAWNNHYKNFDEIRGMTMRWLPHSSVMLSHKLDTTVPFQRIGKVMEILPAEPLAIAKPLLQMWEGKTSFGQDIRAESGGDLLGKTMAGMIGFLAPPIIQNYGFKVTSPDVSIGQGMGLEESRAGGISPVGAGAGALIGGAAGFAAGGVPGAMKGAAAGGVLGGIANVARLGTDTGMTRDPRSNKPKDLPIDFILNNFGAMKSYAARPEQRAQIEVNVRREFGELRTTLKKQAMFHAVNGNEEMLASYLNKVRGTFVHQNPQDPRAAHREFSEWVDNFLEDVGDIPAFKALGKDFIQKELRRLRNIQGDIQGRAMDEWIGALRNARRQQ